MANDGAAPTAGVHGLPPRLASAHAAPAGHAQLLWALLQVAPALRQAAGPRLPTAVAAAIAAAAPSITRAATAPPPPADTVATAARPDHVHCPPALHPAALRGRGIQGLVLLRVQFAASGRAAAVELAGRSGWRLLDEAALLQARGCRFVPARQDGTPVPGWVEFPVRFALAGDGPGRNAAPTQV